MGGSVNVALAAKADIRLQRDIGRFGPIVLQNSFYTDGQKSCGLQARFSSKDVGGLIASR